MRSLRGIGLVVTVMCAGAVQLAAQASPDSVHHRDDCRLASQVVSTGEPSVRTDWAYGIIGSCPDDAGPAILAGMARLQSSGDTTALEQVFRLTFVAQSAAIFATAMQIAGDRTASLPARALALRSVYWSISRHPAMISVTGLLRYADSTMYGRCWVTGQRPHGWLMREPLPADFRAQARTLGLRLRDDPGEPWVVRAVADCVALYPQ